MLHPSSFADYTEQGIGTKADLETAKKWYLRAAGSFLALFLFHTRGDRIATDVQGHSLLAAQDNKRAMQRLTGSSQLLSARTTGVLTLLHCCVP